MADFNFINEKEKMKTSKEKKTKTATSGNPGGITSAMKVEARKLAGSSKGLDIAVFQRKHKIHVMNVDELLEG